MGGTELATAERAVIERWGGEWDPAARVILLPEALSAEQVEQMRAEISRVWEERRDLAYRSV